jgi:hypothetical protein
MRTEPPSPRQPVLAGSASRHAITIWEKSAGTTPAPRPTRRNLDADTTQSCRVFAVAADGRLMVTTGIR